MKRLIKLNESDLIRIVKKVLTESKSGKLEGREYSINDDYTVSIANSKGDKQKIEFSGLGRKINVKDIKKQDTGYLITTLKDKTAELTTTQAKNVIKFVDSNKTEDEIVTGTFTPNIVLKRKNSSKQIS
jgi:hypothetical protein